MLIHDCEHQGRFAEFKDLMDREEGGEYIALLNINKHIKQRDAHAI